MVIEGSTPDLEGARHCADLLAVHDDRRARDIRARRE
jgi:hypothetical protein